MARRARQESLLGLALKGSWKVAALFAFALSIVVHAFIPLITNPILKAMSMAARPLLLLMIVVFGVVASFKLIAEWLAETKRLTSIESEPSSARGWRGTGKLSAETPLTNREDRAANLDSTKYPTPQFLTGVWYGQGSTHQTTTTQKRPTTWSLQLIRDIEWKKFEELSKAYFVESGIAAETTQLGADGGIDIKLYQDGSVTPSTIVQCKAWSARSVGVKQIREFLGVMSHEKIAKGIYMTSGGFTDEAKEVAVANNIKLISGETLLSMINKLSERSQGKLLLIATEGDYTTPTCPGCGIKMVKRSSKHGAFWGCKHYPRCRQKLHIAN